MEQETLFTAVKWDILLALSAGRRSPLELAELNKTSVSNVSQSLRFLELGGLVKSERISNRDKGLPRVIYSLNGDTAYVIVVSENFASKGFIELDDLRKARLRIWMYENKSIQPFLEGALDEIGDGLKSFQILAVDKDSLPECRLLAVGKGSDKELTVKINGLSRKIKLVNISQSDMMMRNVYVIHESSK